MPVSTEMKINKVNNNFERVKLLACNLPRIISLPMTIEIHKSTWIEFSKSSFE